MAAAPITQLKPGGQDQGNQVTEEPNLTIYQRLLAVSQELPAIAKGGHNKEQNYPFIEASAVSATMQDLFAKHGIYMKSELSKTEFGEFTAKSGTRGERVVVWFNFSFVNCFDKDDVVTFEPWPGVAMDYSDKALGKAMTAAQKTFLMKQFLISDVDPDTDSPEAAPSHNQQPATKPAQASQQNRPAPASTPAQQPQGKPAQQPAPQQEQKQPARMADFTKDEFNAYLKEMGVTSAKIAETLSDGKQKTLREWAEAYKAANPEANIKNWYRFGLHEYIIWLEKNNPAAGWLWDKKNQVPRQLEDVPFEETPVDEGGDDEMPEEPV